MISWKGTFVNKQITAKAVTALLPNKFIPCRASGPLPPRRLGTFPPRGRQRAPASPQNRQSPTNKKPPPRPRKGDRKAVDEVLGLASACPTRYSLARSYAFLILRFSLTTCFSDLQETLLSWNSLSTRSRYPKKFDCRFRLPDWFFLYPFGK